VAIVPTPTGVGAGVPAGINGSIVNGVAVKAVVNAKAGLPGVRPRPIKKQRMVHAGSCPLHDVRIESLRF
jgi:hypothetical protein